MTARQRAYHPAQTVSRILDQAYLIVLQNVGNTPRTRVWRTRIDLRHLNRACFEVRDHTRP
jgi:hypothetical protein